MGAPLRIASWSAEHGGGKEPRNQIAKEEGQGPQTGERAPKRLFEILTRRVFVKKGKAKDAPGREREGEFGRECREERSVGGSELKTVVDPSSSPS